MNQEASVEFYPTLYMIGDYFTKSLQGYQLCFFRNIILSIHEYDIQSYNTSEIYFLDEQKLKLNQMKEESQKAAKSQATRETKECVGRSILVEVY